MKALAAIVAGMFYSHHAFAQPSERPETIIHGVIIDSGTSEPVVNASVKLNDSFVAVSDFDGYFELSVVRDSVQSLSIVVADYSTKTIPADGLLDQMKIELSPVASSEILEFRGQPQDTLYYNNGAVRQINYQFRETIAFFKEGLPKYQRANRREKRWDKNGTLRYLAVQGASHHRKINVWYSNGRVKARGTEKLVRDVKSKQGYWRWVRNHDWVYWERSGRLKHKGRHA